MIYDYDSIYEVFLLLDDVCVWILVAAIFYLSHTRWENCLHVNVRNMKAGD